MQPLSPIKVNFQITYQPSSTLIVLWLESLRYYQKRVTFLTKPNFVVASLLYRYASCLIIYVGFNIFIISKNLFLSFFSLFFLYILNLILNQRPEILYFILSHLNNNIYNGITINTALGLTWDRGQWSRENTFVPK